VARNGPVAISRILTALRRAYGPRPPQCWGDGVSVLVDTILSQNTSAANSDAGFRQLRRRFRSWNRVADAPVEEVERHIRVSGLSNLKAPRIQAILRRIRGQRGKIDLQFLADLPDEEAYAYLRSFPGVGPKTAAVRVQQGPVPGRHPHPPHRPAPRARRPAGDGRADPRPAHTPDRASRPLRDTRPAHRAREEDL